METLAERVRTLRKQKKLSQQALGDLAGLSQASIRDIEKGDTLRPRRLDKLAKALGVTPNQLMFGEEGNSIGNPRPILTLKEIAAVNYKKLNADNWNRWIPLDFGARNYDFGILIEDQVGEAIWKKSVAICNAKKKIRSSDTGVFLKKGAPAAILRRYWQEGDRIFLLDIPKQFPPIDITDRLDEYSCLGIVTQLIGNIDE